MHELTKALITCRGDLDVAASLMNVQTADVWHAFMTDNLKHVQAAMLLSLQRGQYELACRVQEALLERLDELSAPDLVKVMDASLKFMKEPVQFALVNIFQGDVDMDVEDDADTLEWIREQATLRGMDPDDAVREAQLLMEQQRFNGNAGT